MIFQKINFLINCVKDTKGRSKLILNYYKSYDISIDNN